MKRIFITAIVILSLLVAGSAMAMARRGTSVDVVVSIPLLPHVVELRDDPYYYHSGYYYHYKDARWFYSKSQRGPWSNLPRDHYPKETRYKGKSWKHNHGNGRDYDDRGREDRGHDHRGREDRGHDDWGRDDRGHDDRGHDDRDRYDRDRYDRDSYDRR